MRDIIELGKKRAAEIGLGQVGGWYHVNDVHRVLGAGEEYFWKPHGDAGHIQKPEHTHRALGIAIRPIEKSKDTAEGLLKEIFDRCEAIADISECAEGLWYQRARDFLKIPRK